MNSTRFFKHGTTILIILMMIFAPMSIARAAAEEYTSYRLGNIKWQTMNGWADAGQAGLRVLKTRADSKGGFYFVQSMQNGCRWRYSWTFSKDVTQISYGGGETAITFRIESDGGTCYNDYNPFVELYTPDDPIGQVVGPNREFGGRFCLKADPNCNRNPTRKIQVYRQTSWRKNASFTIQIIHGSHGLHVTHQYVGRER